MKLTVKYSKKILNERWYPLWDQTLEPDPERPEWTPIKTDKKGKIHRSHLGRKSKSPLKIFGVPIKNATVITRDFYIAVKKAEIEYKTSHPEEYKEYIKVMQHLVKTPRGKKGWHWQSKKHGFGDADINKISFPKGFDPKKNWRVSSGGMFVGGMGGHNKSGNEMDWTWGGKRASLPIPMNLQKLFNKHRISSSSKDDPGHQHHINFYNRKKYSDERFKKAAKAQYHVKKTKDYSIEDINRPPPAAAGPPTPVPPPSAPPSDAMPIAKSDIFSDPSTLGTGERIMRPVEDHLAQAKQNQLKLQALGVEPVVDVISPVVEPPPPTPTPEEEEPFVNIAESIIQQIIHEEYINLLKETQKGY